MQSIIFSRCVDSCWYVVVCVVVPMMGSCKILKWQHCNNANTTQIFSRNKILNEMKNICVCVFQRWLYSMNKLHQLLLLHVAVVTLSICRCPIPIGISYTLRPHFIHWCIVCLCVYVCYAVCVCTLCSGHDRHWLLHSQFIGFSSVPLYQWSIDSAYFSFNNTTESVIRDSTHYQHCMYIFLCMYLTCTELQCCIFADSGMSRSLCNNTTGA